MSPSDSSAQVDLDGDDQEELKEIIIEFLSRYEGLYEKRIQKLIFYGEIHTAKKTGERLTDASFMPYYHGPYSEAVTEALDELEESGRIQIREDDQYATGLSGGDLSPKKRHLINKIHEESKRMSTDELVERAKESWLWKNFDHEEDIDFAEYLDEVLMSPEMRSRIDEPERDPAEDSDLEALLSN